MKRSFAILLTAMLLVCSLTACGRNKDNTPNDPPTTNQNADTTGQNSTNRNPGTADQNSTMLPGENTTQNDGSELQPEETPAGTNDTADAPGVSYEQMLRNGRVHDNDGMLHDGENAGTDITRRVGDAARDMVRGGEQAVRDMVR